MIDDRGDAAARPGLALPSGVEPASAVSSQAAIPIATHMYVGFNDAGEPRACCCDDPGYERQTQKIVREWLAEGRSVQRFTIERGRALFAQGIEARQGGDASCGSVADESPTPRSGDAPKGDEA